jgi:hypothetical protein
VQQGHKVKQNLLQCFYLAQNLSETVSLYVLSPRVLSCPFDGLIALFGGIISTHSSSEMSIKSNLWTLHHQVVLVLMITDELS